MSFVSEGDDIWIGDYLGTVMHVSERFKSGNISYQDGNPVYGREITIFIEEDE